MRIQQEWKDMGETKVNSVGLQMQYLTSEATHIPAVNCSGTQYYLCTELYEDEERAFGIFCKITQLIL